jgi:hypothetical protein
MSRRRPLDIATANSSSAFPAANASRWTATKAEKHPDFVKMLNDHGASRLARGDVRARGQVFVGERRFPKGSPSPDLASFMTDAELIAKYRHNAQGCLTDGQIDEIAERVMQLERLSDFSQVMRLAPGAQARQDIGRTA